MQPRNECLWMCNVHVWLPSRQKCTIYVKQVFVFLSKSGNSSLCCRWGALESLHQKKGIKNHFSQVTLTGIITSGVCVRKQFTAKWTLIQRVQLVTCFFLAQLCKHTSLTVPLPPPPPKHPKIQLCVASHSSSQLTALFWQITCNSCRWPGAQHKASSPFTHKHTQTQCLITVFQIAEAEMSAVWLVISLVSIMRK